MRRFLLIIFIFSLLILSCCTRNSAMANGLEEIEILLQSSPDSGYLRICEYPTERLRTAGDSALYRLLLAEGRYKTFNDDTVDDALTSAADYFITHKDNNRAVRTLFCQGNSYLVTNQIGKGLIVATDALEFVDTIKDYFQAGRIHYLLSELYHSLWDGPRQLSHARQALHFYIKADSADFISDAKLWYGNSLSQMGEIEESSELLLDLFSKSKLQQDTSLMLSTLSHLGNAYLWNQNYRQALRYFSQLKAITGDNMEERDLRLMLWSMIEVNYSSDSIEMVVEILRRNYGESSIIEEYYLRQRNYQKAYVLLKTETEIVGEKYNALLKDSSKELMEIMHQKKLDDASVKLSFMKIMVYLTIGIAVFAILFIVMCTLYLMRSKNHRIDKLLGRVNSALTVAKNFRQQYDDLKLERDNLRKENDNLIEENKVILSASASDADSKIEIQDSHKERLVSISFYF